MAVLTRLLGIRRKQDGKCCGTFVTNVHKDGESVELSCPVCVRVRWAVEVPQECGWCGSPTRSTVVTQNDLIYCKVVFSCVRGHTARHVVTLLDLA